MGQEPKHSVPYISLSLSLPSLFCWQKSFWDHVGNWIQCLKTPFFSDGLFWSRIISLIQFKTWLPQIVVSIIVIWDTAPLARTGPWSWMSQVLLFLNGKLYVTWSAWLLARYSCCTAKRPQRAYGHRYPTCMEVHSLESFSRERTCYDALKKICAHLWMVCVWFYSIPFSFILL